MAAETCELLQDNATARRANRERRLSLLESASRGTTDFWVVHHADWTMPQPLSLPHLTLVKTVIQPDCTPAAIVSLDVWGDKSDCLSGQYRLQVDDSVGPESRVLAIFDGVVLLEWRGELRYLTSSETAPEWHMVWHAPWTVFEPRLSGSSSAPFSRRR